MKMEEIPEYLYKLPDHEMVVLRWYLQRRENQIPPDPLPFIWFLRGGRGSGKTKTAANHIFELATKFPYTPAYRTIRVALVGERFDDVKSTMIEGEALALDTLLPTSTGYVTMGEVKVGDVVLGGDGRPCSVVAAWPVTGGRPCYEVALEGGVKIVADGHHRWLTEDCRTRHYNRRYGGNRPATVVTTEEMRSTLRHYCGTAAQANHGIAVSSVESPELDLPVDPYVLGAWLGDGKSNGAELTTADQAIVDWFELAGFEARLRTHGNTGKAETYGFLGLRKPLRLLGLLDNKHIPSAYLRSGEKQRLALVQGLMDTDGYVSTRGQCEFINKNHGLTEAVVDLLCGLGIKASAPRPKLTKFGTVHWLVKFTTTLPVFRLERKLERLPKRLRDNNYWYVQQVAPVASVPVRCITVDSPDNTYLVTRHHVRTHNTGLRGIIPRSLELAWNRSLGEFSFMIPQGPGAPERREVQCSSYTSERPDQLRGPQFHIAWLDEPAKLKDADEDPTKQGTTFSNIMFGLRLGEHPHLIASGTPTPCKLIRHLANHPGAITTHMSSLDNREYLPQTTLDEMARLSPTSRTYRQEVLAEILEDNPDALFDQETIDNLRLAPPSPGDGRPELIKVLGYDPSVSSGENSDEAGIVLSGYTPPYRMLPRPAAQEPAHAYVLTDLSGRMSPTAQTERVIGCVLEEKVDALVFEQNQGVEFVLTQLRQALTGMSREHTIRELRVRKTEYGAIKRYKVAVTLLDSGHHTFHIYAIHASSGKKVRAEIASMKYDSKQVHHPLEPLILLEDEMTAWNPVTSKESPNRLDALVYCLLHIFGPNTLRTATRSTVSAPGAEKITELYPAGSAYPGGRNTLPTGARGRNSTVATIYSLDIIDRRGPR